MRPMRSPSPEPGSLAADPLRPLPSDPALWARVRTVAVLGAHREAWRPACYVPEALHRAGLRVLPVNAALVAGAGPEGIRLWGEPVRAGLGEIGERVDLVDIFRRAEALPDHLPELLELAARQAGRGEPPPVVWTQSGIRHAGVAAALRAAGCPVVEDACAMVERRRAG